jgi:hypothetical protein
VAIENKELAARSTKESTTGSKKLDARIEKNTEEWRSPFQNAEGIRII